MACSLSGWALVPLPLLGYCAYKAMRFYQPANRELMRLESTTKSPIFQLLGEMVSGSSTIRAFGKQEEFNQKIKHKLDISMNAGVVNRVSATLFSVVLFNIAFVFLCIASVFIVSKIHNYRSSSRTTGAPLSSALFSLTCSTSLGI